MIKDLFNVKKTYSLIILFLCLLIAHSFYAGGVDDNFFASYFNQLFILNKSNFLIFRFETWSSRIFIEFFFICTGQISSIVDDSRFFNNNNYCNINA